MEMTELIPGVDVLIGLDILLDGRSAMVMNSEYDISTEVIAKLDEAEKANKGAATAPAQKPAAPAARPPVKK